MILFAFWADDEDEGFRRDGSAKGCVSISNVYHDLVSYLRFKAGVVWHQDSARTCIRHDVSENKPMDWSLVSWRLLKTGEVEIDVAEDGEEAHV
jgi:hypothetical protein